MDGPGDRAPKHYSSREPTRYIDGEGQAEPPTSVDVARAVPPGSYEFGTSGMPLAREPGGLTDASPPMVGGRRPREGHKPQSAESTSEESDAVVVPEISAKMRVTPFESMEERTAAKGKAVARHASLTQGRRDALTHLQRLGERAKKKPKDKWTNLLSHVQVPLLLEAYTRLRKQQRLEWTRSRGRSTASVLANACSSCRTASIVAVTIRCR